MLTVGCTADFLEDMRDYNNFDDSLFDNEATTLWYMNNLYSWFYGSYSQPTQMKVGLWDNTFFANTEEAGGINNWFNPNNAYYLASYCPDYYGSKIQQTENTNNPYTRIRYCNYVIQFVGVNGVGTKLTTEFLDGIKGQCYYLRALQYFDLVRTYGGVPIVTTVISGASDDESIKYPRATSSEVFAQIAADLDKAAELLPAVWTGDNWGRPTSCMAKAMKSRAMLTAASPLFNTDWDNTSNQKWQTALQAGLDAEQLLSANGFGLYGTTAKDWEEMFYKFDNTFCSEAVAVQLFAPGESNCQNNGWENRIRPVNQNGNGGIAVPKEMIDAFPMADGHRPTDSNGAYSYDDKHFFLHRDPRFYRTFRFTGCKWPMNTREDASFWAYIYIATSPRDPSLITRTYHGGNNIKSPVCVSKMSNPQADSINFQYSGTDILEYRYAELMLNIAECYAATGNTQKCREYIGRIRARVGIPEGSDYYGLGNFTDKYAAIEATLFERRIELAYEGKRFWDMQRWMLFNDSGTEDGIDWKNNTCAKLGLTPLNGTCRTGQWLAVDAVNNKDPYTQEYLNSISIDLDAADLDAELQKLVTIYDTILKYATGMPDSFTMDASNNVPVTIDWKQHYYIFGLNSSLLSYNPWLEQTIGWLDYYGGNGTYDFRN